MYTFRFLVVGFLLVSLQLNLFAVFEKQDGNEFPWGLEVKGWHDRAIVEKLGGGFFMNVGPTGIRARITHEHPKFFTVKFVFENSPAAGKIEAGDIIIGANKKIMDVKHNFAKRGNLGWEGPMVEMSKLIEESQKADGKLELIVWPQGKRSEQKNVIVQIEAVGGFSKTYPYNCERSDKLMNKLCDFIAAEHRRKNGFNERPHTKTAMLLALMASGEKKYDSIIREEIKKYYSKRYDSENSNGFQAWSFGHDGVVMGEYYHLTKDKKLLPAIQSLSQCIEESQAYHNGGYCHKPYPTIVRRFLSGGPKGYGPVTMTSGIIMAALSILKRSGLNYSTKAHKRLHYAYIDSVNSDGGMGYGLVSWDNAVINLQDGKDYENGTKGIGFPCPSGMKKGFDKYEIEWPTKEDPRYRDTGWIEKERATNKVFDFGKNKRLIIREMTPDSPSKPYGKPSKSVNNYGRSGVGALAHLIGSKDKSWKYVGDFLATASANSGNRILSGHASSLMHPMWGSLAAAMADVKEFRKYMDDIKWWMIMAETHDNGFVVMPGRDYASTDHVYGKRQYPSAVAALTLSVKERKLLITGSDLGEAISSSEEKSTLLSLKKLTVAQKEQLKKVLLETLVEIGTSGKLKKYTVSISKTKAKLFLVKAEITGKLTFQLLKGTKLAVFQIDDLNDNDHAMLSMLAAALKPEKPQTQIVAALYMNETGKTDLIQKFLDKSNSTHLNEILNKLSN